jgi:hypothetical protein
MSEEEARAISEPLSSYLVRNADVLPVARQILENYDLLAITIGVGAYVSRVYHDRSEEVQANRAIRNVTTSDRIHAVPDNGEKPSEVWTPSYVSNANAKGSGSTI